MPTITQEELAELESQGALVYDAPPPSEDAGSKDYTTVKMEVYESMELNAVPSSLFKIKM